MNTKKIRVHFFGSPEFALPSLIALVEHPRIEVSCVITQEDQPSGRGLSLQPPVVGKTAKDLKIPLFQPTYLKKINWKSKPLLSTAEDISIRNYLSFLNSNPQPDFFVVVGYGKLLPEDMLSYPLIDTLNVHPSLLPRWRGAAPLQRTLFAGDTATGVCIMSLVAELDAGAVYAKKESLISEDDTLSSLHDRLSRTGGDLLAQTIIDIVDKDISPTPQAEEGITYAEKWKKEESIIDWNENAAQVLNRIRACSPRPGARTTLDGKDFKILRAEKLKDAAVSLPAQAGTLFPVSKSRLGVTCGDAAAIELLEVQISGKKSMLVRDFLQGHKIEKEISLHSSPLHVSPS